MKMHKWMAIVLTLMMALPVETKADEGMWILSLIGKNYEDMRQHGFQLTAEDLYNVNHGCIKDAVVGVGNSGKTIFGTGEMVSAQGLFSTNHHVGFGALQAHSTVEHDYLRDGFWAKSRAEELPNPDMRASIIVRIDDVSERVLASVNDGMSETERAQRIKETCSQIEAEATRGTYYTAYVRPMYHGNQYFLTVSVVYRDVRLVGAPPSSIAVFGGDTDNWMWPRHTGDFAFFRIYTAPDGSPADYNEKNVPLQAKHFFPINIGEMAEGDYAMVIGFPGNTDRFATSYGLTETMEVNNTLRHDIRTVRLDNLREEMLKDQAINIMYAGKYKGCANYWKNYYEQNKSLRRINTMQMKLDIEQRYMQWAKGKEAKYGQALGLIQSACDRRRPYLSASIYLSEGLISGAELPNAAFSIGTSLLKALGMTDKAERSRQLLAAQRQAEGFYKNYSEQVERRVMKAMFTYVANHIDSAFCPEFLKAMAEKNAIDDEVEKMFSQSIFANKERFDRLMENPDSKTIESDPFFVAGKQVRTLNDECRRQLSGTMNDDLARGMRHFTDGILQMSDGQRMLSPDANYTLRCSYGNVRSYRPRNAVSYDYYTTMEGVMEKEDANDPEFVVPERQKELFQKKDYGRYANTHGELPVCFITTNDITGGNSGSPVLNARGELIGIVFDGNSEALCGDLDFEENLQRTICVDYRYVLWVTDRFAGAKNIIDELTIIGKK